MSFAVLRSFINSGKTTAPDFSKFNLISKLPYDPFYNQIQERFIPTLIKNSAPPANGLYFTKEIGCADDIVLVATKEFNNQNNKNLVEYRALGF